MRDGYINSYNVITGVVASETSANITRYDWGESS